MSSVILLLSDLNLNRNKRTDFLRTLNMKFHEKPSGGTGIVACGRTDRHDEASRLFAFRTHPDIIVIVVIFVIIILIATRIVQLARTGCIAVAGWAFVVILRKVILAALSHGCTLCMPTGIEYNVHFK